MTTDTDSHSLIPATGIIVAGTYPEHDPRAGLEETLDLFAYAEELGFDVAGVRQRHLERGVSSALTFLAAVTQRTSRIRLETDVIPLGYETPFRLAEDFATVDALSGGRLNVGVSTSAPHADLLRALGRPDADPGADPFELISRFLEALEGHVLGADPLSTPYGPQVPRIQPHVPALRRRVWLGGGSLRSVRWAAARGLKLLLGNVGDGDAADTFEEAQAIHIAEYHRLFTSDDGGGDVPEVAVERVILPIDTATAAQRAHYAAYASERDVRTAQPVTVGSRRIVFQRDLYGTAAEIADRLASDPSFDGRTELRVALPYGFALEEYRQILFDVRHAVLPLVAARTAAAVGSAA
ncbi:MAG: LLM class flavin-dependent oxidoreductase [Microbacterium sp.]|uniref:LLM class flavin-dependent oxidoreductase n=1 Tax=Microbacterium sp. TaxID=51671 RepID=UPI001AC01A89|nr:LLM class flavin-dependent oxidoreductase [Microbacterium sp.]MBN9178421.1 LLM class flavin-dependent oxidoreductase [Microbacterium sp.]